MKIDSGRLARMADGAAVATMGDTSVLVTAVGKTKSSSANFVPLVVDYRQKAAAAGRIPTNFMRRELGSSDKEILTSRLIDRSLRPLFPEGYYSDTQIMCNLLAVDGVHDPDVISINAASAALSVSDIPWNGPIGAVRVGLIDNEVIVNPTRKEQSDSILNLIVVAAHQNLVVMLEATADCVKQQDFLKAIKIGVRECQHVVQGIQKLQKEKGKPKRQLDEKSITMVPQEITDACKSFGELKLKTIFTDASFDKLGRDNAVTVLKTSVVDRLRANFPEVDPSAINEAFSKLSKSIFRNLILEEKSRFETFIFLSSCLIFFWLVVRDDAVC